MKQKYFLIVGIISILCLLFLSGFGRPIDLYNNPYNNQYNNPQNTIDNNSEKLFSLNNESIIIISNTEINK